MERQHYFVHALLNGLTIFGMSVNVWKMKHKLDGCIPCACQKQFKKVREHASSDPWLTIQVPTNELSISKEVVTQILVQDLFEHAEGIKKMVTSILK